MTAIAVSCAGDGVREACVGEAAEEALLPSCYFYNMIAASMAHPDALACGRLFSSLTATVVVERGNPLRLDGSRMSRAVFDMLGVRPSLGRTFLATDDGASVEPVVVLSDSMWQRYFGGQTDVLGRSMLVNGNPATIVGVMPAQFQFPDAQTLFCVPFALDGRQRVAPVARLADGVTAEAASANVDAVLHQIRKTEPRAPGMTANNAVARFEVRTIR